MGAVLPQVEIQELAARQAFAAWSRQTGIALVIDWNDLALQGVSPDTPINLQLRHVPASEVLQLLMKQAAPDVPLLYEVTPWYVQVLSKEQASRMTVVRVYDINDLLAQAPQFRGPKFDLASAMSSRSSGGGSAPSGGGGLFATDDQDRQIVKTKSERGEEIAQLIRDTIEPEVWQERGGSSSIRYFQGKLAINAPLYVHRQIGWPMPVAAEDAPPPRVTTTSTRISPAPVPAPTPSNPKAPRVSGILPR
jgi:hypothetical protein